MNDFNSGSTVEPIIEASDIHKSYRASRNVVQVLTGTSFEVRAGELLGIVGASGVGKSTLLHIIGGLDHPDSGRIHFKGEEIYSHGNSYLEKFRNTRVGFVFQFFNLLSDFTALENTMFPALIRGVDKKEAREKAETLLCQMGLKDRLTHKPAELSGGEGQRVALARALVNQPDLLLADEPTGNLDMHSSDSLMELIRNLNKEFNQTFVIVTHNQRISGEMDRVLRLADGKVSLVDNKVII